MAASCGKLDDKIYNAQQKIVSALRSEQVYERGNLPDPAPSPSQIKGYFDIVGGTYRYIVNEERNGREAGETVDRGDRIAFRFDGRIFTGGVFDRQQTFYTNIPALIELAAGGNPNFNDEFWPDELLEITVGEDTGILKSLQEALISCRAGDGDPENDDQPGGIASDRVRVYLTPDLAFGDRTVYNVPAGSTLVFEVSDIVIIK